MQKVHLSPRTNWAKGFVAVDKMEINLGTPDLNFYFDCEILLTLTDTKYKKGLIVLFTVF